MIRAFGALLVAAGTVFATPVWSAGLPDIRGVLIQAPLVCGNFTQSKSLKALTRPLISQGRVVFATGIGVLWQPTSPFPSQVLVKADALIRWDSENKPKRTGFGQSPQFRALSDVFLAVFAGDTSRLAAAFDTVASVGKKSWSLVLKPRDKGFAARISGIRVSGGQFVEELQIAEGQGDTTVIRFKDLTADGCALSDTEKDYLAH